jgi:hypothetical protein
MPEESGMSPDLDADSKINDGNDESRRFLFKMQILAAIGCSLILVYSLRYYATFQCLRIFAVGMLVAGAALLSGFLLGFIFAFPRVGSKTAATPPEGTQTSSSPMRNGNLVEISDWLTKIIVGVSLVELHSIRDRLGELSYYLAPGLQPAACGGEGTTPCTEPYLSSQAACLAIIIFFFTLGFLLGYVWTMIFFQGDLEGKLKDAERQKEDAERQKEDAEQQREEERHLKQTVNICRAVEELIHTDKLIGAMEAIDKALATDPQNGLFVMTKARVLKRQALQPEQNDREYLLKQAIVWIDQAIALLPGKGEPIYNKACYQTLLDPVGLKSEILSNLEAAFHLNPDLRQSAQADADLEPLKDDSYFVRLTS